VPAHCSVPSAFHTVLLPPLANEPAQRTRRTNAFAAARGDKTAMRLPLPTGEGFGDKTVPLPRHFSISELKKANFGAFWDF